MLYLIKRSDREVHFEKGENMTKLELTKQLSRTYYMMFLTSGLEHYKVKAYEVGEKYKRMKKNEETIILKIAA